MSAREPGQSFFGPIAVSTRRGRLIATASLAALIIAAAAFALTHAAKDHVLRAGERPPDAGGVEQLYAGIAEDGQALGSPRAPITMVTYEDPQCPVCRVFAQNVMPALVRSEVRPGHLRLVLRPLAFLGPGSRTAALTELAAARQNRMFEFTALLYAHQGDENSGWVSPAYLRQIGTAVVGLDIGAALRSATSARTARDLEADRSAAHAAGVTATPTVLVGHTGGRLRPVQATRLTADQYLASAETGTP